VQGGVEERVLRMQIAADNVGAVAAAAVAQNGQHLPRRRREQGDDRHTLSRLEPADVVLVTVRQHDHVAGARPMSFAVCVERDPQRALGDDVEEDQPLCIVLLAWPESSSTGPGPSTSVAPQPSPSAQPAPSSDPPSPVNLPPPPPASPATASSDRGHWFRAIGQSAVLDASGRTAGKEA